MSRIKRKLNEIMSFVSEQEAKFVQDRITGVEKHLAELCAVFAAFARKAARCDRQTVSITSPPVTRSHCLLFRR